MEKAADLTLSALSLAVEQVSSGYAARFGVERDAAWFLLKLQEELGELVQAHLMLTGQARAKGMTKAELETAFRREIADVLCQTLLLARFRGIDLGAAIDEKWLGRMTAGEPQVDDDLPHPRLRAAPTQRRARRARLGG
jgi:NTP pyrophosphatase (non-canonical NTP hydrolase)